MAEILGTQTVDSVLILNVDVDPSIGPGTAAPTGSFAVASDGSGSFYKSAPTNTAWYRLNQSNDLTNQNLLLVRKNPTQGQYATIEDALAAITTNSPTNPFVISVGVGIFDENQLNCKPYVSIVGTSIQDTIIKPLGNHDLFVVTDVYTELSFMSLQSVPAGKAAIFCNDSGDYFQAHKLNFVDCDINVKLVSVTQDTIAYLEYVDYNGVMSYGNHITSGGFKATIHAENYYTFPSASGFTADFVTGVDSFISITSSGIYGNVQPFLPPVAGNFGVICENGAEVSVVGSVIAGFECAIKNNNVGAGCVIDCVGVMIDDCTNDIIVSNPFTTGAFNGTGDLSKITIDPSSTFTAVFSQAEVAGGGFVITGDMFNGSKVSEVAEITTLIKNQSVGKISGGALSDGGGFTVNVASGIGYLLNGGNNLSKITWGNTSISLSANVTKYIYFNSAGVLSSSAATPNSVQNVILGRVNTNGASIEFIDAVTVWSSRIGNKLSLMIRGVFGSLYQGGSVVTENATPLKVDVTNGEYYFGANQFTPSGGTAIIFDRFYQDGLGGWTIQSAQDTIPNNKWDDGSGTLQNISLLKYVKHLMFIVGDGANEKYFMVYGQTEFNTLTDAELGALPVAPTYFDDGVVRVASFIVQQGTANIVEILSERPFPTTQSSASVAVSNHLMLSNLTAGNAGHPQFMMLNGTTPMIGDLDMGLNDVVNAGNYNGVTVEAHAARHLPNGLDPLTTAAPTTNLGGGSTNSVGIQNSFARSDHSHAIDQADALTTGLLKAADWVTFNNKQNALGYVPVNKAGDNGVGLITFLNNQGIDVDLSGGSDVLNIGTSNADIINIGYSGSVVNIIGTLSYQNVDNLQVKDKLFTVNKGGGVGSGASAGFEIEENAIITGWFATSGTRDGWDFKAPAIANYATLSLANLTANLIYFLPNVVSGKTLATIDGGQTFSAAVWNASVIGIAYGGTGAATALAAFNNLSPLTTKGDIITHDGTNNIRKAVGNNTQVFIADSAQVSGNRWGDVFSSILTPATFAATQNDYNPAGLADANVLRLSSTGARLVTGITAPATTKTLVIFNVGASNITFVDNSASSVAANRFQMNGNTLLNPNEGAIFWYDITTARWRCAGKAL